MLKNNHLACTRPQSQSPAPQKQKTKTNFATADIRGTGLNWEQRMKKYQEQLPLSVRQCLSGQFFYGQTGITSQALQWFQINKLKYRFCMLDLNNNLEEKKHLPPEHFSYKSLTPKGKQGDLKVLP